jgi:hypothetical protein
VNASAALFTIPEPVRWVCLDIETQEGSPDNALAWVRHHWWPQENLKPETSAKKLEQLLIDKVEKLALLDAAPLATVQLGTQRETLLLHVFGMEKSGELRGAQVTGFTTEGDLLKHLRTWLEARCAEDTTIVGWNIRGFDLPRLRMMYLRNGLRIPAVLDVRADVYDMMKEYCRNFSVDRVEFLKLAVALEALNIPSRKTEVNGSHVGAMVKERRIGDLLDYALSDICEERELFLRMSGQKEGMQ